MTVSDLITLEEVEAWSGGDIITIAAPTGKGKSHFIKNSVYEIAKKHQKCILFLVHRINCYTQFSYELKGNKENDILLEDKTDIIDIKTYQSIDKQNYNQSIPDFDLSQYDYIVCDEFHYFMSDASFNEITDISLDAILNESEAIRIFVSATSKYMKYYFKEVRKLETIDYEIEDKDNFIERLEFFYNNDVLEKYLNDAIERKIKGIFFIDNKEKAFELYSKFKDKTIFNCSKGDNDYYKYVDEQQIKDILEHEGFDKVDKEGNKDSTEGKIALITTSVMDSGINIWDDDLKHIVCDIKDTEKLIQCIGRKRRKVDEKVILHIKALSNKQLGGIESFARINNKRADDLKELGSVEYINKYGRSFDNTNTIYLKNNEKNIELKVNEMKYTHNFIKYSEMQYIKKFNSKHNYCEYIKSKLKADSYSIYSLEAEKKKQDLEEFIYDILGKKLMKEDQSKLIDKIDLNVNGRKQRSYEKLNQGLEMLEIQYRIKPKKSNNNRYWIIEKI